jgi:GNAT superfamily N-acetyltransferase
MIATETRHLDYYCGQHDMALIATVDGIHSGTLRYVVYEGEPSVSMIKVRKSMRKQGIGTALVVALQREYPDIPIQFGYLTEAGSALLNSLEWDVVTNDVHEAAVTNLARVEAQLRNYTERARNIVNATQAEKDAFTLEVADWNDLSDDADRFREIVATTPSTFRFVVDPDTSVAKAPKFGM